MNAGCAGKTEIPWEHVPYLSTLQIQVYLYLTSDSVWLLTHCIVQMSPWYWNAMYWSWKWLGYAASLAIDAENFCKYCESQNINLRLCDVSSRAFWSDASPSHGFSFNFSRQAVCFFKLPVTTSTINSVVGSKKQFNAQYHVKINTRW